MCVCVCLHARLPILEQKGIDDSAREMFVAVSQMSEWCADRCEIMLANFVRSYDSLRAPNRWFTGPSRTFWRITKGGRSSERL